MVKMSVACFYTLIFLPNKYPQAANDIPFIKHTFQEPQAYEK